MGRAFCFLLALFSILLVRAASDHGLFPRFKKKLLPGERKKFLSPARKHSPSVEASFLLRRAARDRERAARDREEAAKLVVKPFKGARLEPADMQEALALEEARAGAGQVYRNKLKDKKYGPEGTHIKMEYNHDHRDGTSTEIHYDVERATGIRSGFKIKDDTNKRSRGHLYLQIPKDV